MSGREKWYFTLNFITFQRSSFRKKINYVENLICSVEIGDIWSNKNESTIEKIVTITQ